jgi:hypothetical protein
MSEAANQSPAGTYTLNGFYLMPSTADSKRQAVGATEKPDAVLSEDDILDIKMIVHTWSIKESFTKGHISGSAKVYDSEGIFYSFPLRGQERVRIVYTDFFGIERQEDMFLYAVTDVATPKASDDSVLEYNIHFASYGKFWSDRFSVSRCIADGSGSTRKYIPINEQVETIFEDYYKTSDSGTEKEIVVHETEGNQKIVIPNMRPEAAMHLMSRKAYTSSFPSSYYRFFETREKYHFVNLEEIFSTAESKGKYTYVSGPQDETPQGELNKMSGVISLDFHTPVDTFDAMKNGAYYRKVEEVDITNRMVKSHEYTHEDEYKDYQYPGSSSTTDSKRVLRHTSDFIKTHMNDWSSTYVIKDYPDADMPNAYGIRPKPYYGEILNSKNAHIYDYRATRLTVTIYGNNELFPGDLIDLEIPYFNVYGSIDEERSGVYLIESIDNIFYENSYMQKMRVSRGPMNEVKE